MPGPPTHPARHFYARRHATRATDPLHIVVVPLCVHSGPFGNHAAAFAGRNVGHITHRGVHRKVLRSCQAHAREVSVGLAPEAEEVVGNVAVNLTSRGEQPRHRPRSHVSRWPTWVAKSKVGLRRFRVHGVDSPGGIPRGATRKILSVQPTCGRHAVTWVGQGPRAILRRLAVGHLQV